MKILVPIKRAAGYNVKIRVTPDGSGLFYSSICMIYPSKQDEFSGTKES